jgi:DNA-binding XRE family transcriptional regulator
VKEDVAAGLQDGGTMPGDTHEEPGAARPLGRVQDIQVAGKAYVLVPKDDFERLRLMAEGPREDTATLVRDSAGPDLRARRRQAGLTLAEVAQRAGIRQETLSRIENSRTDPSVRTVRSILRALNSVS